MAVSSVLLVCATAIALLEGRSTTPEPFQEVLRPQNFAVFSTAHGFDFITAGIFDSGMGMRIDVLWMKPPKEKWLSQLPVPGGAGEEKMFSWLCCRWNRRTNKVLPPCREVGRAFAHLHVQAGFVANTSPLLAALSHVAGGRVGIGQVASGGAGMRLDSSTALFLLKKGDVAAQGWVIAWSLLPQITLEILTRASNGV